MSWQRVVVIIGFLTGAVVLGMSGHNDIAMGMAGAAAGALMPSQGNGGNGRPSA